MKITRTIVSLAAAAVLTLSACGGGGTTDPASDEPTAEVADTEETDPAAEDTAAEEPAAEDPNAADPNAADPNAADPNAGGAADPNASGDPAQGLGAESPNNAASPAIDAFIEANPGAQRIPVASLDSPDNLDALKDTEMEPAECKDAALASGEAQLVEGTERDGAVVIDQKTGTTKSVVVAKFPDAGAADNILKLSQEAIDKCAESKITMGGQSATMKQAGQDAKIDGASKAISQSSSMNLGGTDQTTYATIAVKDEYVITSNMAGNNSAGSTDETDALAAETIAALG